MTESVPAASDVSAIAAPAAFVGTFSNPAETFRRLVAHPTWWLPFLLTILLTTGLFLLSMPKLDWDKTIRDAMEKRAAKTGQTIPPEIVNRQIEQAKKMTGVYLGFALGFTVLAFFVVGLVLWGAARAMGADARYAQLLAIWAHASLPNLVGGILAIPLIATLPDASATQTTLQGILRSNLGAFLADDAPAALRSVLGALDLFSFAVLALLVVGFRKLPGLSKGAATAIPIVLWLVYVIGKTAWMAFFG
ncbi:MAG: YIP1 family protein [Thermoanaerobaculia bacterium]